MTYRSGRHFLQLPGPTNTPERILRAIARPVIDHRGPEFATLARAALAGMKRIFKTDASVFIYPSSATGAWESALANTLSAGDRVLLLEHGFFAVKWGTVAERLGLEVESVPGDWRVGPSAAAVGERLAADAERRIKAVLVVHNETSTGVTTRIPPIREAIDAANHPALLMVDAVSSLAATDLRHDEWGIDVTVSGSQKGLMLPPGLSFTAASSEALAASERAGLPHSYWSWADMAEFNERGFFPYTPATNLLFGLAEAVAMLEEEGLDRVFARHARHGAATRLAVLHWGLENVAVNEHEFSNAATSVLVPEGSDADRLRGVILERFDMSLGKGLGQLEGRVFRIGHLGDLNDLMLAGTLSGVEMGLRATGIPHRPGGAQAACDFMADHPLEA